LSCTSAGLSRSSSFYFFFFFFLSFGFLFVFCSSNVSIDEGMFGFSIGASTIGLGEFRESNGLFVMILSHINRLPGDIIPLMIAYQYTIHLPVTTKQSTIQLPVTTKQSTIQLPVTTNQ
jgi:hypothetical protein